MGNELERLRWHARRGMLELDSLFQCYFDLHGKQIGKTELLRIEDLLQLQDQELFDAFSGKRALTSHELEETFRHIIICVQQAGSVDQGSAD